MSNTNSNSITVIRSNEEGDEEKQDKNPMNAFTDSVATTAFITPDAINHPYFNNRTHSMRTNVNASNCTSCFGHSEFPVATTAPSATTG